MQLGLLRANHHTQASLEWTNTVTGESASTIACGVDTFDDSGKIRLCYVRRDEAHHYRISVTTTRLPWGGVRWWFICPMNWGGRACLRRVGKLYLPPGLRYFGCRHCFELTYRSCQESHKHDAFFAELARDMGVSPREAKRLWRA